MKILGDELIKFEPLFLCKSKDEISNGRQNLFKFDRNLIKRALEAGASFSIIANDINEAIIANAAGAKFIIADIDIAKDLAKIAESYLFDALIAVLIKDESELAQLAKFNIDAAILPNAIKK
ncbi:hypothetical protein [Campylobacter concisus]|jgi:hypothetical protein|uniref:hypothetical protein n=1 Tax=Campylobacter concisus TaxID=199 RepID=UPI0009FE1A82|nr:hypothetical protein [Campylobacter concisus]ORI12469.1 hypothetical protein A3854_00360 [Campylobacter concisus]